MAFKTFFFAMSPDQREGFAAKCGTSVGMLNQVAYGNKQIELGFADVLVANGNGYSFSDLPLTDRAIDQNRIRSKSDKWMRAYVPTKKKAVA